MSGESTRTIVALDGDKLADAHRLGRNVSERLQRPGGATGQWPGVVRIFLNRQADALVHPQGAGEVARAHVERALEGWTVHPQTEESQRVSQPEVGGRIDGAIEVGELAAAQLAAADGAVYELWQNSSQGPSAQTPTPASPAPTQPVEN